MKSTSIFAITVLSMLYIVAAPTGVWADINDELVSYQMSDEGSGAIAASRPGQQGAWRFKQAHISGNAIEDLSGGKRGGAIAGEVNLESQPEALVLNGATNYVSVANGPLPVREISLEAWVEVDAPVNLAGIISYIQDNGPIKHGWILGQSGGAFMFGLSSASPLTYLMAEEPFDTGKWYYVVGTYDGSEMNIYINGRLAGSSNAESGDISYLPGWFRIGSYKDDDEQYLWNGMIAEAAVYDRALSSGEVLSKFEGQKAEFGITAIAELKAGPYVHFSKKGEVTIYWKTDTTVSSVVKYGVKPDLTEQLEDPTPKTSHQLTIAVRPETDYVYAIVVGANQTNTYEFYTAFDFGPEPFAGGANPYPPDGLTSLYEQAAEYIISSTGITKGVCIDYGCGKGRLAYEIAKRSDLKIIGFEQDTAQVAQARNYLDQADIYGVRVTVLAASSLSSLKCRNYSANLIVSDRIISQGVCPGSSAEMFRVLRPDGGIAFLGQPPGCPNPLTQAALVSWLTGLSYTIISGADGLWAEVDRGALSGAGEWTHYYADIANTANSTDSRMSNNLKMLWYGQPGPRYVTDRHNRTMSSLYKNGIVLTPGIHRLMAFDAYNGARYWDMAIPDMTRVAILRDCGWMALAGDYAYVAHKDDCVGLALTTGVPEIYLEAPQLIVGQKRNWGYVAVDGDNIYGSGQKEGASLIGHSRAHVDEAYYDDRPIATSDYLFCLDRYSGTQRWTYKRATGSVIINPAIAVGGDYIYFIESRNPSAVSDSDGRVLASVLLSGNNEYLVKLNKNTGAEATAAQQYNLPFQHVIYLLYAAGNNLVIATGVYDTVYKYGHYAFNAGNLSLAWSSTYNQGGSNGSHGEQDQHPCIVGSMMYNRYCKVDLTNGATTGFALARGNCGTQSACATHLFGRNANPYIYPLPGTSGIQVTAESRPGCWINMMATGGLLLIPEASSGCTCDYPLQATMALMPE